MDVRFSNHFYESLDKGHSDITEEIAIDVIINSVYVEPQMDDTIDHFGRVDLYSDGKERFAKVVTNLAMDLVITAHVDSNFRRKFRRLHQ